MSYTEDIKDAARWRFLMSTNNIQALTNLLALYAKGDKGSRKDLEAWVDKLIWAEKTTNERNAG